MGMSAGLSQISIVPGPGGVASPGSPGDFAPTLNISSVPIPGAFWLLGLAGVARRRKAT
jgi:hypothetical protein